MECTELIKSIDGIRTAITWFAITVSMLGLALCIVIGSLRRK